MSTQAPLVSVLTVNFHSEAKVAQLRKSLKGSTTPFELIVVDNSKNNKGFSVATNKANQLANGKYIFICNPDVVVNKNTLQQLEAQARLLKNTAVIAPQLTDNTGQPYLSTTGRLNWLQMVVAHSFINKVWRQNFISRQFWGDEHPLSESRYVESASGAALFMSKYMFEAVGGFDEQFFLYFEDNDFCNRVAAAGYRIWYEAGISIIHEQHGATNNRQQAITFFRKSRWLYSKKTFGLFPALISESWLRLSELVRP